MSEIEHIPLDIAVIGGGPAGVSACIELSKSGRLKVAIFEKDPEIGGMPRSCHIFFGMRDLKRIMTGSGYARLLDRLLRMTSTEIHTDSTVIEIQPGTGNGRHGITVASPEGVHHYGCRAILLATGCFEISRGARMIPGTRPDGIFTTGTLQEIVNMRGQKPGNRAVIIGSEHVSLSSVLTLRKKRIPIAGMIEEDPELHTFSSAARAMGLFYRFPIYKGAPVQSILGDSRVEGVMLAGDKKKVPEKIKCDTIILTGKFRPYSSLIDSTPVVMDPATSGPLIDMNFMTTVPNLFAAGNILRGADMHDLCALEGKIAAGNIIRRLEKPGLEEDRGFYLKAESPIRYVVPQKVIPEKIRGHLVPHLFPGCAIQLEHSMDKAVIEAWSNSNLIWGKTYRRLIANHRIVIPIWKFDLKHIDREAGVTLRLRNLS